jgi:hypothetical protein
MRKRTKTKRKIIAKKMMKTTMTRVTPSERTLI